MLMNPRRSQFAAATSLSLLSILASACSGTSDASEEKAATADLKQALTLSKSAPSEQQAWARKLASNSPELRAEAADATLAIQAPDAPAKLEQLIKTDPEPLVRERAILAYGQLQKKSGIGLLKEIALTSQDPRLSAAALASLAEIREEAPEPERGFLSAEFPKTFAVGTPFDVRVRFGSTDAVPRARLALKLPTGLEVADKTEPRWSGAIPAGGTQELTFTLIAKSGSVRSGALVNLKLDYPEQLDSETHKFRVRVAIDNQTGTFADAPAPISREL